MKTFFELQSDFLQELYSLLAISLETQDYVSPKMARKLEKKIVKGAFKTWNKIHWKHRFKRGYYSLRSLKKESEPTDCLPGSAPRSAGNLCTAIVVSPKG